MSQFIAIVRVPIAMQYQSQFQLSITVAIVFSILIVLIACSRVLSVFKEVKS